MTAANEPTPSLTLSSNTPRGVQHIPECACLDGHLAAGTFEDIDAFLVHVLSWHSDDLARLSSVYPDSLPKGFEFDDLEPLLLALWPIKQPIQVRPLNKDVSLVVSATNRQELVLGRSIKCRGYGMNQVEARMMAVFHGLLILVSGTIDDLPHPFAWKLENAKLGPLTDDEQAVLKKPLCKTLTHFKVPKGPRYFARGGFYRPHNFIKMYPEEHQELVSSGYHKTHFHHKVESLLLDVVKVAFPMYFTAQSIAGSHFRVTIETDHVTLYGDGNTVLHARYNALRHLVYLAIAGHEPSAWRSIVPKPTRTLPTAQRFLRVRKDTQVAPQPAVRTITAFDILQANHRPRPQSSSVLDRPVSTLTPKISADYDPPMPLCFGRSTFKLAPLPPASSEKAVVDSLSWPRPSRGAVPSNAATRTEDFNPGTLTSTLTHDRDRVQCREPPAAQSCAEVQDQEGSEVLAAQHVQVPNQSTGQAVPPVPTAAEASNASLEDTPTPKTVDCVTPSQDSDPAAAEISVASPPPPPADSEPLAAIQEPTPASSPVIDVDAPSLDGRTQLPNVSTQVPDDPRPTRPNQASAITSLLPLEQPALFGTPSAVTSPPSTMSVDQTAFAQLMVDLQATRNSALMLSSRVHQLEMQLARFQGPPACDSPRGPVGSCSGPQRSGPLWDPSHPNERTKALSCLHTGPSLFASSNPPELDYLDPAQRASVRQHALFATWLEDPVAAMQLAVWQQTGVFLPPSALLVVQIGHGATGTPLWLASVTLDGKQENVATGTSDVAAVREVTARLMLGEEKRETSQV